VHTVNCVQTLKEELVKIDSKRGLWSAKKVREISPEKVRSMVRTEVTSYGSLVTKDNGGRPDVLVKLVVQLLKFCSHDVLNSGVSSQRASLTGLLLLPLSDNKLAPLGTVQAVVAVESEQTLLQDAALQFVHPELADAARGSTRLMAVLTALGVRDFAPGLVAYHLHKALPAQWRSCDVVGGDEAANVRASPFFRDLWMYIAAAAAAPAVLPAAIVTGGAAAVGASVVAGVATAAAAMSNQGNTSATAAAEAAARCDAVAGGWPIIPTTDGMLTNVAHRKGVLPPHCDQGLPPDVLQAVGAFCPSLDPQFAEYTTSVIGGAAPVLEDTELWPAYLAGKLGHSSKLATASLEPASAAALCRYFSSSEALLDKTDHTRTALRMLPMYETHGSGVERVRLTGDSCTFDPDACDGAFQPDDGIFVKHSDEMAPLYSFLNVPKLEEGQLYAEHVLPRFDMMPHEQQDRLLAALCARWETLGHATMQIRDMLAHKRCIVNEEGARVTPGTCVDPSIPLLAAVFGRSSLPSNDRYPSNHPQWSAFLRDIGVRHNVDEDLFLECCQSVAENHGDRDDAALIIASHTLVKYLIDHVSNFPSPSFYQNVRQLPIIAVDAPVAASRSDIGGGSGAVEPNVVVLVRFQDAAVSRDEHLVFLVRPMLPAALTPSQVFWGKLGVQSPPPPEVVVDNIAAIGAMPSILTELWPFSDTSVDAVFNRTYEFLEERWDRLGAPLQARLRTVPIVPVGHCILPVSRVFFRLQASLAPWVFELPRSLGHDQFFTNIGVRPVATVEVVLDIIESIASQRRGAQLNPSELHAFIRLLEHLQSLVSTSLKTPPSLSRLCTLLVFEPLSFESGGCWSLRLLVG
jgi:hypothetical protein